MWQQLGSWIINGSHVHVPDMTRHHLTPQREGVVFAVSRLCVGLNSQILCASVLKKLDYRTEVTTNNV